MSNPKSTTTNEPKRLPIPWNSNADKSEAMDVEGFTVYVRKEADLYPDTSYLGTFTDKWENGAVRHSSGRSANDYEWWVPMCAFQDHYTSLVKMGRSKEEAKELARSYVDRDYERHCSLGRDWDFILIRAGVYKEGVELGDSCIGGVESDSDDDYIDEVAWDCIQMAVDEAKKTFETLGKAYETQKRSHPNP